MAHLLTYHKSYQFLLAVNLDLLFTINASSPHIPNPQPTTTPQPQQQQKTKNNANGNLSLQIAFSLDLYFR